MNRKWLLIILILFFPLMVHATSYTHTESVERMKTFHENYYDSKKYILQKESGLLSNDEYKITMPDSNFRYGYSYLYDGQPFWLSGGFVNLAGKIDTNTESTPKGFKATLYVDPTTNSAGSGTYSNPWIFLQKYKVNLVLDSKHGGICDDTASERCSKIIEESSQMVIEGGTATFTVAADAGFSYLNNTCNGIYTSGGGDGTGTIRIYNIHRNIVNCKLTFGTGLYALSIRNTNPDDNTISNDVLFTIYEEYSKGWFTTNDKAVDLSQMRDIIYYYNHTYDPNRPWLINVRREDGSTTNLLIPESGGYTFGGIKIPVGKLDGSTDYRELTGYDGKIKSTELIKSDLVGLVYWEPNKYHVNINDCYTGTSCSPLNFADGLDEITFNTVPSIKSGHIKQHDGYELQGYYSAQSGGSLIFDKEGKYVVETEGFGKQYRVAGDTTVYARYTKCNAGYYSNFDAQYKCTKCPQGTFSSVAASGSCAPCEEGSISGEGATSCNGCEAGQRTNFHKTACVDCEAGTFSSNGKRCLTCSTGTISGPKASECHTCPIGEEVNTTTSPGNNGHTQCISCSKDKYKAAADTSSCKDCAVGKITGETIDGKVVRSKCEQCSAGSTANADRTECVACSAGTYSNPNTNQFTCKQCDEGYYSSEGSDKCTLCGAGYASKADRTGCDACSAGSYSNPEANQLTCKQCDIGYYSPEAGSSKCTPCSEFVNENNETVEKAYSSKKGQSTCDVCGPYEEVVKDNKGNHIGCRGIEHTVTLHNNVLPNGYTRVDSIKKYDNNEVYINLDVKVENNFGFYIKYKPYDKLYSPIDDESHLSTMLGGQNTSNDKAFILSNTSLQENEDLGSVTGGLTLNVDGRKWGWNWYEMKFDHIVENEELVTLNINYNQGQDKTLYYINRKLNGTSDFRGQDNDVNLYLFANNVDGTAQEFASAKLYRLKLFHGTTPFADYIPCKNPSGTLGLCNINAIITENLESMFITTSNGSFSYNRNLSEEGNSSFKIRFNDEYTTLNVSKPTADGLAFDGWWTQEVGGTRIFDQDGKPVLSGEANKYKPIDDEGHFIEELYAHWKMTDSYN